MADDSEHRELSRGIGTWRKKARDAARVRASRRKVYVLVAVAIFTAVVVVVMFLALNKYIVPETPGQRKDLVLTLAQILGGVVLLFGLYSAWNTLQVNREGQITERYTRAIDQLGSNKDLEIRLGGIYALERIARDSARDHWTVMEVLTAYVRQHAPWPPQREGRDGKETATVGKPEEDSRREAEPTEVSDPALDIQAIITVIRRRTRSLGRGELEPLDLHEANLSRAYLLEADLSKAILYGANLSQAILSLAFLSGASLSRANLREAVLWGADLSGAALWKANLSGANFMGADLSGTNLSGANLSGAEFASVDLSEAEGLDQQQIEQTIGDNKKTKLPEGLHPPAGWSKSFEEQLKLIRGDNPYPAFPLR